MVRGFAPYPFSDKDLRRFTLVFGEYRNGARFRTLPFIRQGFTPVWGRSTTVENPLQIHPFYAKQSQFSRRCKINIKLVLTEFYEEKARFARISNQSQTKQKPMLRWVKFSGLDELRPKECDFGHLKQALLDT
jgi:hypothetical protein